jgi:hypothetical protein
VEVVMSLRRLMTATLLLTAAYIPAISAAAVITPPGPTRYMCVDENTLTIDKITYTPYEVVELNPSKVEVGRSYGVEVVVNLCSGIELYGDFKNQPAKVMKDATAVAPSYIYEGAEIELKRQKVRCTCTRYYLCEVDGPGCWGPFRQ